MQRTRLERHVQDSNNNTQPLDTSKKNGIYAVASGKGGVGKTWFAISLSDGKLFYLMVTSDWQM